MKALIMLAVDITPEGYEKEYGVEAKPVEVLDYVKDLVKESAEIRLNVVGGWAQITNADITPPVAGSSGGSWEEVWEQVRRANAEEGHLSRFVAIMIPSPFLEPPGTFVVAYVDRETQIRH